MSVENASQTVPSREDNENKSESEKNREILKLEQELLALVEKKEILTKEEMEEDIAKVVDILKNESEEIRPRDSEGGPGGMIELNKNLPTIIIPDLHARRDYLAKALLQRDSSGRTNLDKMMQGELQVVCLGDGMHAEGRAMKRWGSAEDEYNDSQHKWDKPSPNMDAEMTESFGTMKMIMLLKQGAKDMFHYLKGNHDNILCESTDGNKGVLKFAFEGPMVQSYVEERYGADFIKKYSEFEKNAPIMVVGNNFAASHSRPDKAYRSDQIINYRSNPDVILGLTWTRSNESDKNAHQEVLTSVLKQSDISQSVYIHGHDHKTGMEAENLYRLDDSKKMYVLRVPPAAEGSLAVTADTKPDDVSSVELKPTTEQETKEKVSPKTEENTKREDLIKEKQKELFQKQGEVAENLAQLHKVRIQGKDKQNALSQYLQNELKKELEKIKQSDKQSSEGKAEEEQFEMAVNALIKKYNAQNCLLDNELLKLKYRKDNTEGIGEVSMSEIKTTFTDDEISAYQKDKSPNKDEVIAQEQNSHKENLLNAGEKLREDVDIGGETISRTIDAIDVILKNFSDSEKEKVIEVLRSMLEDAKRISAQIKKIMDDLKKSAQQGEIFLAQDAINAQSKELGILRKKFSDFLSLMQKPDELRASLPSSQKATPSPHIWSEVINEHASGEDENRNDDEENEEDAEGYDIESNPRRDLNSMRLVEAFKQNHEELANQLKRVVFAESRAFMADNDAIDSLQIKGLENNDALKESQENVKMVKEKIRALIQKLGNPSLENYVSEVAEAVGLDKDVVSIIYRKVEKNISVAVNNRMQQEQADKSFWRKIAPAAARVAGYGALSIAGAMSGGLAFAAGVTAARIGDRLISGLWKNRQKKKKEKELRAAFAQASESDLRKTNEELNEMFESKEKSKVADARNIITRREFMKDFAAAIAVEKQKQIDITTGNAQKPKENETLEERKARIAKESYSFLTERCPEIEQGSKEKLVRGMVLLDELDIAHGELEEELSSTYKQGSFAKAMERISQGADWVSNVLGGRTKKSKFAMAGVYMLGGAVMRMGNAAKRAHSEGFFSKVSDVNNTFGRDIAGGFVMLGGMQAGEAISRWAFEKTPQGKFLAELKDVSKTLDQFINAAITDENLDQIMRCLSLANERLLMAKEWRKVNQRGGVAHSLDDVNLQYALLKQKTEVLQERMIKIKAHAESEKGEGRLIILLEGKEGENNKISAELEQSGAFDFITQVQEGVRSAAEEERKAKRTEELTKWCGRVGGAISGLYAMPMAVGLAQKSSPYLIGAARYMPFIKDIPGVHKMGGLSETSPSSAGKPSVRTMIDMHPAGTRASSESAQSEIEPISQKLSQKTRDLVSAYKYSSGDSLPSSPHAGDVVSAGHKLENAVANGIGKAQITVNGNRVFSGAENYASVRYRNALEYLEKNIKPGDKIIIQVEINGKHVSLDAGALGSLKNSQVSGYNENTLWGRVKLALADKLVRDNPELDFAQVNGMKLDISGIEIQKAGEALEKGSLVVPVHDAERSHGASKDAGAPLAPRSPVRVVLPEITKQSDLEPLPMHDSEDKHEPIPIKIETPKVEPPTDVFTYGKDIEHPVRAELPERDIESRIQHDDIDVDVRPKEAHFEKMIERSRILSELMKDVHNRWEDFSEMSVEQGIKKFAQTYDLGGGSDRMSRLFYHYVNGVSHGQIGLDTITHLDQHMSAFLNASHRELSNLDHIRGYWQPITLEVQNEEGRIFNLAVNARQVSDGYQLDWNGDGKPDAFNSLQEQISKNLHVSWSAYDEYKGDLEGKNIADKETLLKVLTNEKPEVKLDTEEAEEPTSDGAEEAVLEPETHAEGKKGIPKNTKLIKDPWGAYWERTDDGNWKTVVDVDSSVQRPWEIDNDKMERNVNDKYMFFNDNNNPLDKSGVIIKPPLGVDKVAREVNESTGESQSGHNRGFLDSIEGEPEDVVEEQRNLSDRIEEFNNSEQWSSPEKRAQEGREILKVVNDQLSRTQQHLETLRNTEPDNAAIPTLTAVETMWKKIKSALEPVLKSVEARLESE